MWSAGTACPLACCEVSPKIKRGCVRNSVWMPLKKIRWCYAFRRSHILRFSHQHLLLGTTFEHSGLGGCGSNWRGGGTHSSAKQISHHVSILAVFSAASRAAGCCRCCCWWCAVVVVVVPSEQGRHFLFDICGGIHIPPAQASGSGKELLQYLQK